MGKHWKKQPKKQQKPSSLIGKTGICDCSRPAYHKYGRFWECTRCLEIRKRFNTYDKTEKKLAREKLLYTNRYMGEE